jgi:hypothetical protein
MSRDPAAEPDPIAVAARFVKELNARRPEALAALSTEDVEWRTPRGESKRGVAGLHALVGDLRAADMSFVVRGDGTVDRRDDGTVVVHLPVREAAGDVERERVLELEIHDGRVAAFAVRATADARAGG